MIRAFFVTLITFIYILVLGPPVIIYGWISGNTDPIYKVGMLGARMGMWLAGVKLELRGKEKIPRGRAVVFMPNHQGNFDPPAVIIHLPPVVTMVKKEFFRVPILGAGMRARGFIAVDRRNREQAIKAVEQAVLGLQAGKPFLAFPEGTRSRDGRLQPFKKGVFVMAIKAGVPIVPISVSGSRKIMPKGKFEMRPGRVVVTFHDPIPTEGFTLESRQALIERVREAILSGLAEDEQPLEGANSSPNMVSTSDFEATG